MLDGGAVLNEGPSRAVVPAPAQFRVERVEDVRIQRTDLDLAQERRDVVADVTSVERQGTGGAVELVEVALQQLVHRGFGSRVPPVFNLADQPVTDPTRLLIGPGPGETISIKSCRRW